MFSVAWKMLGAATIVTCFHTARILLQDEHESELESDHTAKNW
jgi:cell division protein FtsL